jgi:hypothetical protein
LLELQGVHTHIGAYHILHGVDLAVPEGEVQTVVTTTPPRIFDVVGINLVYIAQRVVPIVPDEARTFGMEGMFRQLGIYAPEGQKYTPVDKDQVMYYREDAAGLAADLRRLRDQPAALASAGAAAAAFSRDSGRAEHGLAAWESRLAHEADSSLNLKVRGWSAGSA